MFKRKKVDDVVDRSKFTEADKIFVPEDTDSDFLISDFTEYKVRFFRTIPEECTLVKKNRYAQELINVPGPGYHFMMPYFTKSILVSNVDRTLDYPPQKHTTKDNTQVSVDMDITVKIVDAAKYIKQGKYQLDQLKSKISSGLQRYVKENKADDLRGKAVNLSKFDYDGSLKNFANKYGIAITSMRFKAVEESEAVKEAREQQAIAEQKQKAAEIESNTKKIIAKGDADAMRIRGTAEAEVKSALTSAPIQGLRKEGISSSAIERNVGVFGAKNSVFIGGGSSQESDTARGIAAGVVAGNAASKQQDSDTEGVSRVDSLVRLIDFALQSGFVSDDFVDSYSNLRNMLLNNANMINLINGFSDREITQLKDHILSGNLGGYSLGNSNGRSRRK